MKPKYYVLCSNPKCSYNKRETFAGDYCPLCGEKLITNCPQCGANPVDKGQYCQKCSSRLRPAPPVESE